jgi:spermidine synthase
VNQHPLGDSRTHVIIDDARTYLKVNAADYDLIVSEPSHPWVSGVANLFTREFFALGRDRLRGDGVFVQWLQTYQLSTESLRSILATFHEVFPHMLIFRVQDPAKGKDLILVGSRSPLDSNRIPERLGDDRIVRELGRAGIRGASDLQSNWFVCDEMRLVPALVGAQINSDDNMLVETRAPRDAFRPTLQDNAAWIEALRKSERAF